LNPLSISVEETKVTGENANVDVAGESGQFVDVRKVGHGSS
jgi:hypothetical protein